MTLLFKRYWGVGWTSWKDYYKVEWIFHFNYYPRCVWQLMIFGFYVTSVNKESIKRRV